MARMRRFTRWRDDHRVITAKTLSRDYKGDFIGKAVDQLAAYEDTGLTPTQVKTQQGELCCLYEERERLLLRIEDLEAEVMNARSEREYFRSRAEFFREMAGVPGFVGGHRNA